MLAEHSHHDLKHEALVGGPVGKDLLLVGDGPEVADVQQPNRKVGVRCPTPQRPLQPLLGHAPRGAFSSAWRGEGLAPR